MNKLKKIFANLLTLMLVYTVVPACSFAHEKAVNPIKLDPGKPQAVIPKEKLEYLIKIFESRERTGWQMPEQIMEELHIKEDYTIADIGAGTGYFTHLFAQAVSKGKTYALDVDPGFIKHLMERFSGPSWKNVAVKKVPHDDPELADRSCDLIFISNTWHHVSGRPRYLSKIHRALKDQGRLVIVDYRYWQLPDTPNLDHRIPRDQVLKVVRENGFKLHAEYFFLPRQYFLIFKKVILPQ